MVVEERWNPSISGTRGGGAGVLSSCKSGEENSDKSVDHEEGSCMNEASREDQLKSAKSEMSEVREENTRLKALLEEVKREYKSLQTRFVDAFRQEPENIGDGSSRTILMDSEEHELISLRLGTSSSGPKKDKRADKHTAKSGKAGEYEQLGSGDLKLRLDCRAEPESESPENSGDEAKNEETTDARPASKVWKTSKGEDDEASQQSSAKRARVSVRARCDTPTMPDGCQWRKYGQKISKGNPCPRAYYRCTVSPACPVRKQVQRCAKDMSILITTYEGTHNHPLPASATAMASSTSAAASMLLSGSSSAQPGLPSLAQSANLQGPIYPAIPSFSTFPTITLDLTSGVSLSSGLALPPHSLQETPRFPSRNFSFSSPEFNILPTIWGNLNPKPYDNNPVAGSLNLGRSLNESPQQAYFGKNQQVYSTETLTKAITSDPSFRSLIAAAISSMAGVDREGMIDQSFKSGDPTHALSSNSLTLNGKTPIPPSYLTRSSPSNSQIGRAFQQAPLSFSPSSATPTTTHGK